MKKILAIALAAVMTLAVLAVAVNAEAEPALLITADQIAAEGNQTSAGIATVELVSDEGGFARITSAGDDPWIMIKPVPTTDVANKYATFKYRSSSTATLGIEVYTEIAEPHASAGADAFQNDGQWHTAVIDLSTAQDKWQGNISRIDPMNAAGLPAGEVIDIAWVAVFADENDAKAYTGPKEGGSSEQPAQPAAEPRYVWNHTGEVNGADPFNDTTRVGHDSAQTATIRFKTDVKFSKILFPMIWATPHANVTVELLSNGTSVYSGTTELFNESAGSGDVANVEFDIGKKLPAGEYTMVLSAPEGFYAFFAYGADPLSADYIEFERGHALFGLYTEDSGNGFVTFATEVNNNDDEQQTNPGTSDVAVIAIAAVACIALAGVVVAKKVK